jgi:hypothetical protein
MDPNKLLAEILRDALELREYGTGHGAPNWFEDNTMRLAENVIDLNDYLMRGGFLPSAWVAATVAESDITRDPED